jgi:secreted trypsin-like serine protease
MSKSTATKRKQSSHRLDPIVAKAVREAQKAAPGDDREFFNRLKEKLGPKVLPPPKRGGGALSTGRSAGPQAAAARVRDDPRYVANLRTLARRSANARIIGGTAVTGADLADCVAVGSDTAWGCTGTLIAPNVVLTAAHCESLHTRVFVGSDVTKPGRIFKIKKHIRHESFDPDFRNDLMILILEKKVTGVKPRAMATTAVINKATVARLAGFGSTSLDGTGTLAAKLETSVPIVSQKCDGQVNGSADSQVYHCHLNKEIVAGKPLLHQDTCKGDSGGPLLIQDANGRWLLAGVTSRGTALGQTMCGDGGVYVRVDAYKAWITKAKKG